MEPPLSRSTHVEEIERLEASVAALTAALEAQCFDHADNCCADWCAQCQKGRALKIAALDAAAGGA